MSNKKLLFAFFLGLLFFVLLRLSYAKLLPLIFPFYSQSISTTLVPPKTAVVAAVDTIKGDVEKEGRKDTKFQKIQKTTTLVEGESIQTGNGSVSLQFPDIGQLSLQNNTQIDFLNGLADALVVRQPSGVVTYTLNDIVHPFSVRSLGLLIQFSPLSSTSVLTDTDNQTVTVNTKTGSVTLAYSDANDTTKVVTLTTGQAALYNYQQSLLTVE